MTRFYKQPAYWMLAIIVAVGLGVWGFGPEPDEPTEEEVEQTVVAGTAESSPASRMTMEPEMPPNIEIVVNIPATEMALFEDGVELFRRRIAIGRGIYPTPEQESTIRRIEWNPWWYPPPSGWARNDKPTPPGPGNPLGVAKMALGDAILFHGTNKAWTVGRAASHGCMRMNNDEVEAIAWYLQRTFSDENDPKLLQTYRSNRRRTHKVRLHTPVPVRLVYRPVELRADELLFFPDHYNRYGGRRKAAIIAELMRGGIAIEQLDDDLITRLAQDWPERDTAIPVRALMRGARLPSLLSAPECS